MAANKILITGINGFLGGYIARNLLLQGHQIRATVQSIDQSSEQCIAMLPNHKTIEYLKAGLYNFNQWDNITSGCKHVIHCEFPLEYEWKTNPELLHTFKDTSINLYQSCRKNGVEKLILFGDSLNHTNLQKKGGDENDWGEDFGLNLPFELSMGIQKHILEDMKKYKDGTEVISLNLGNQIGKKFTEHSGIGSLLFGLRSLLPNACFSLIGIDDVLKAVDVCLQKKGLSGKRLLLVEKALCLKELKEELNDILKRNEKAPLDIQILNNTLFRLFCRVPKNKSKFVSLFTSKYSYNCEATQNELGFRFGSYNKNLLELLDISAPK